MNGGTEVIQIEKPRNTCKLCEEYAAQQAHKPIAVLCCEGACLRGEIARRAADVLCRELAPERTARIRLGGAFTKEGGSVGEKRPRCHTQRHSHENPKREEAINNR